jgi:catechol 2,3-dioxygenase-like lactoylglutathione lyase family enzyme
VERTENTAYLTCNQRHHEHILIQSPNGERGLNHLAVEIEDGTLPQSVDQAVSAGARVLGTVDEPGVAEAVMLEDPLGFRWKLFTGMEQVEAPAPLDVPRPETFSHYNLAAPNVTDLVDFLVDGLGLKPSDWLRSKEDPFVCWFHCDQPGALHHGIAIINTPETQLHHIAFDYADIGAVAKRVDNYVTRDRVLVWGMGRHGTGGGIFSYIEDPARLMIELSAEMIHIGEDPRWNEPEIWDMDDPRGVNAWGDPVPGHWVAHGVPLSQSVTAFAS